MSKGDEYLRHLGERVARGQALRVGFLEGSTYPDGTPVAQVAAIQNFGAPAAGIPPRPFFTGVVEQRRDAWGRGLAYQMREQHGDAEKALAIAGEVIAGDIRQSIIDMTDPPLAEATVAARTRGTKNANPTTSAKPLVDTGLMLASVGYEVDAG